MPTLPTSISVLHECSLLIPLNSGCVYDLRVVFVICDISIRVLFFWDILLLVFNLWDVILRGIGVEVSIRVLVGRYNMELFSGALRELSISRILELQLSFEL